ncbi:helix-turn-helix transcriptional regulator [Sinisalibacter aestuarii]|uniref:AraC family transcriptional regulator n=1 Tax=Sinisalibacter aestuarii TaxID=2949426 RepID=A0ABQ5LRU8_9RHOB|nr:AraC family transcriptional regulator [Sinisalibacter aestuarii]GKY87463.1 AraC family transcriptional regulator [Sinisalibacter aestuarii]
MPALVEESYSNKKPLRVPRLYSVTRDFEFLNQRGKLVHNTIPSGPMGYSVVSVDTTGHRIEIEETARVALSMPLYGLAEVAVGKESFRLHPGTAVAIRPSVRCSKLIPSSDRHRYQSVAVIAPPGQEHLSLVERSWVMVQNTNALQDLRELLRFVFSVAARREDLPINMAAHVENLVHEIYWQILSNDVDVSHSAIVSTSSQRLVRLAQEYIRANFSEPISVQMVADAMGVCPRTLQYAFAGCLGRSPRQYITDVRIDEMHRLLSSPLCDYSVISAAMSVGLVHIGRASQSYRLRFGELPSETLKRTRAPRH